MGQAPSMSKDDSILDTLQQIPCFHGLTNFELEGVASRVAVTEYKSGDAVISEGTVGNLFGKSRRNR
jgi:signal-transduction protein with cAMP-binding, CBS, and nucleotidyltransferase domain